MPKNALNIRRGQCLGSNSNDTPPRWEQWTVQCSTNSLALLAICVISARWEGNYFKLAELNTIIVGHPLCYLNLVPIYVAVSLGRVIQQNETSLLPFAGKGSWRMGLSFIIVTRPSLVLYPLVVAHIVSARLPVSYMLSAGVLSSQAAAGYLLCLACPGQGISTILHSSTSPSV